MSEKDEYKEVLEKLRKIELQQSENVARLVNEAVELAKTGDINPAEVFIVTLLGQISQELAGIRRALNLREYKETLGKAKT